MFTAVELSPSSSSVLLLWLRWLRYAMRVTWELRALTTTSPEITQTKCILIQGACGDKVIVLWFLVCRHVVVIVYRLTSSLSSSSTLSSHFEFWLTQNFRRVNCLWRSRVCVSVIRLTIPRKFYWIFIINVLWRVRLSFSLSHSFLSRTCFWFVLFWILIRCRFVSHSQQITIELPTRNSQELGRCH